ncbi:hypothetical protein FACS1894170_11560 [Planctomycetales bacterium]|nr:hypothetical protein FACS1894170_11560 [Planctomycetales bacterium]
MNNNLRRRALLGTVIGGLVAAPYIVLRFRSSVQLPTVNPPGSVVVPSKDVPKEIDHDGDVLLAEATFESLALPDKSFHTDSLTACVSADSKLLLVSYSYGSDWKGRICYADVPQSDEPLRIEPLCDIPPQSFITSIGCSSEVKSSERRLSYVMRFCQPDQKGETPCYEMLFCRTLSRSGSVFSLDKSESEANQHRGNFLMYRPNGPETFKKDFGNSYRIFNSHHCWVPNTDTLFFGGMWGINQFTDQSPRNQGREIPPQYQLGRFEQSADKRYHLQGCYLGSNAVSTNTGGIRFVEASYDLQKDTATSFSTARGFNMPQGHLVSLNEKGEEIERQSFPSVYYGQKSILTSTHWCATDLNAGQVLIAAPLDHPKKLMVFGLPQAEDATTGINWKFRLCALLPDGRHILCSRIVQQKWQQTASTKGMPLCELGIIELPLSLI